MVTSAEIKKLFPSAKPALVAAVVDGWPLAEKAGITTAKRIRQFLANIGTETGGLRLVEESLNYASAARIRQVWPSRFKTDASARPYVRQPKKLAIKVYGGRMGNAPDPSTDGWDFRGGGMLQTTGREGFRKMGFEDNPGALREPATAFATAVREWEKRGCNTLADQGQTTAIRKKINGGTNGLADVKAYLGKAEIIFTDVKAPKPAPVPAPAPGEPGVDTDTVRRVQQQLKDLGYTEVGGIDGKPGTMTATAIRAFRAENGLPPGDHIDDDLLLALQKAPPRKLHPDREAAPVEKVAEKAPETAANWRTEVIAKYGTVGALLVGIVDWLIDQFKAGQEAMVPLLAFFGSVPKWVWFGLAIAVLGALWWHHYRGRVAGVEAFRTGARR